MTTNYTQNILQNLLASLLGTFHSLVAVLHSTPFEQLEANTRSRTSLGSLLLLKFWGQVLVNGKGQGLLDKSLLRATAVFQVHPWNLWIARILQNLDVCASDTRQGSPAPSERENPMF